MFGSLPGFMRLRVYEGDITSPDLGIRPVELAALKKTRFTLWHLAADLSFAPVRSAEAERTNEGGTRQVVAFANRHARKLIHMSTAYVCGDTVGLVREDGFAREPRFRNHYERSKHAAEAVVRKDCVVPYLVFRPSIVIGDAYEGKAEGCTFGYYRFAFMLHILHEWMRTVFEKRPVAALLLRLLGTRVNAEMIRAPWLVLPYPRDGVVDMVPVDYVVRSLLEIAARRDAWQLKTFHLTQVRPLESIVVMRAALEDFNIAGAHYVRVSPRVFGVILHTFYVLLFPLRQYTKSVFWYVPYVLRPYRFDHAHTESLGVPPAPAMTRASIGRINAYAKAHVFPGIHVERLF